MKLDAGITRSTIKDSPFSRLSSARGIKIE
jgi:hypothetical protein